MRGVRAFGAGLSLTAVLTAGCAKAEVDPISLNPTEGSEAVYITEWTGEEQGTFPFPGRVTLPEETCEKWSAANPQPGKVVRGILHLVIDARNNRPQECDPDVDTGAGRYSGASIESPVKPDPNGERYVLDGTVVQVRAAEIGQFACNHTGESGSAVWVTLWDGVGDPEENSFSVSASNVGFVDMDQLAGAGIVPTESHQYAGTRQGGC